MRGYKLKKSYITPEIDYVKIDVETVVCTSAETPIDDIIEHEDGPV